jgi:hypothetical protein
MATIPAAKSNEMVTVACKLPHGLHLDLPQGEDNVRVTLNGSNSMRVVGINDKTNAQRFGLTGVPKDFYETWLNVVGKQYAPVKAGLIFAHKDARSVEAKAMEHDEIKNGFEGAAQQSKGMKPEDEWLKNHANA